MFEKSREQQYKSIITFLGFNATLEGLLNKTYHNEESENGLILSGKSWGLTYCNNFGWGIAPVYYYSQDFDGSIHRGSIERYQRIDPNDNLKSMAKMLTLLETSYEGFIDWFSWRASPSPERYKGNSEKVFRSGIQEGVKTGFDTYLMVNALPVFKLRGLYRRIVDPQIRSNDQLYSRLKDLDKGCYDDLFKTFRSLSSNRHQEAVQLFNKVCDRVIVLLKTKYPGIFRTYWDNGSLQSVAIYREGKRIKFTEYDSHGNCHETQVESKDNAVTPAQPNAPENLVIEYIQSLQQTSAQLNKVKTVSFEEISTSILTFLIPILAMPIMLLNIFGGIIAFIWLAILGKGLLIFGGIIVSFLMPRLYFIPSLPSIGLALIANALSKHKILQMIVMIIAILYNNALTICWVFIIFAVAMYSNKETIHNPVPYILWGYSTALSPLQFMASSEPPEALGATFGLIIAVTSYMLLAANYLFGLPFIIMASIIILLVTFAIIISLKTYTELSNKNALG